MDLATRLRRQADVYARRDSSLRKLLLDAADEIDRREQEDAAAWAALGDDRWTLAGQPELAVK